MKLLPLLIEQMKLKESLHFEETPSGEFMKLDFYNQLNLHIGTVFIRLKKKWNQVHIDIKEEFQRKGFAAKMLSMVIEDYGHISIPEGRIANQAVMKVIDKLKNDFDYFKTEYDEHILFDNQKIDIDELLDIYK